MIKKSCWKQGIPYAIVILLLLIASFYDYAINTALYHPQNLFGLFFERIILFPIECLIPIGFMILYRIHHKFFYAIAYGISCAYIVCDALHFWFPLEEIILALVLIILVFTVLLALLLQKVPMHLCIRYEKFFIFLLLVMLCSLLVTTLLKQVWGRVRYREMLEEVSMFTNWFQPAGWNGHHSFPSGHTTMMTSIICFLELHRSCGIQKRVSILSYLLIFFLILAMMFSRILVGAHFLSDVSIGFAITYTMYLYWRKRLFREVTYE